MKHYASRALLVTALVCGMLTSQGLVFPSQAVAQTAQRKVSGTVKDANGEPLIGVTVMVPGKASTGTVTDFDGNYTISCGAKDKLTFSYVGYTSQTLDPKSDKLDVTMKEDAAQLEEVVVVGFGQTKKESLTGAVSTVSAKQFEDKGSLSSPLEAMQGQVAGVIVTRSSSAPGDESWNMNVRGSVSANSTEPLVIIDGVAANSVSELRNLNSNDIESMNILKDGAAAIYGSRAAGGVILVTTKKGKEGKMKIDYDMSVTVKTPGLQPELMNSQQWAQSFISAYEQGGIPTTYTNMYKYAQMALAYPNSYINLKAEGVTNPLGFTNVNDYTFSDTDWLGGLFGTTTSQQHNVSISGGTEKNSYRISIGYNYDGSTLKYGNNNNKRLTFRISDTYHFTKKIKLDSNIGHTRQWQVTPSQLESALKMNYAQPGLAMVTADGKPYSWGDQYSPYGALTEGGDNKLTVSMLNISETLNYDITDWLTANVNVGYNTSSSWRDIHSYAVNYYDYSGENITYTNPTQENSYSRSTSNRTDFFSVSGYVNGHKSFKDHNLSLTLGTQYEYKENSYFGINAKNTVDGISVVNGIGDITAYDMTNKNYNYQYGIMSYFFRFNYDWKSRYLVEFNGRYDGSSKFLPENRWDFFWGVSLGWRVNEEKWFKDLKWLTNLKLRASYARVGNQSGIDYYDGYQMYSLNMNSGSYIGSDRVSTITTSGTRASTTRTWEKINNYNLAVDFGFQIADGHNINGTVEVFKKTNNNMLVSVKNAAQLGDSAPNANVGAFKDSGWEGSINYNGKIGQVTLTAGGTFTYAHNELTDYQGTSARTAGYTSTQVGYGLNSIFGYQYCGKIQNEEQLAAYINLYEIYYVNGSTSTKMNSTLRVGDNMYADLNGDHKIDNNDLTYLGSSNPEIQYSFNFGAKWKGFDVNVVFQGAANRFVWRGTVSNWTVPFRSWYYNNTTSCIGNTATVVNGILANPEAYYASLTIDSNLNGYNYQPNSITAQDASYLRLKTITIGYTIPKKWLQATHFLTKARVYVTGTDLWEHTNITDGFDPEAKVNTSNTNVSGTALYPFTRNVTFGLDLSF